MKRILVIGATGAQGGSVASHLLERDTFGVRAMTRNPDSPRAQELRERGAEIVRGDLENRASLRAALKGVHGVFGVIGNEEHGRNLVNAVAGAEVEHLVLSTIEEIEQYARRFDIAATFVHGAVENIGGVVAAIFERP